MITTYLKLGGILALAAALFGGGFYFGGLGPKTALEGLRAAQAAAVAQALATERSQAAAQALKQQKVIATYEDALLQPLDVSGIAHRVLDSADARSCPLPEAAPNPAGAPPAPAVAVGPSAVGDALADLIQACRQDAAELAALQALSPR